MKYIADLHIHSKYSRSCSKDLDLEHNNRWAKIKGIGILGTGDFTHPAWFAELKNKLTETKSGSGLFILNSDPASVNFMLTTELSCIYKQGDKVRRIHLCVLAPNFLAVDKIIADLKKRKVNLASDGRPIMGIHADELTKIVLNADPKCMMIPAHVWTPWFSVFGSKSGFDTLKDCFGEMTKHIYAIETGLSSDPEMNWRLSMLDNLTLVSNSDAHSPANLGREANVFDIEPENLSYDSIFEIIKTGDKQRFLNTIEFFPEEGKYHADGHRICGVQFNPEQTNKHKGICPACKKPLTIGVLNRVHQLADRTAPSSNGKIPYLSIVPLAEVIAEVIGQNKNTKRVKEMYDDLIKKGGSEFEILLDLSYKKLSDIAIPEVVMAIKNIREKKVVAIPGYDGVYGTIKALGTEKNLKEKQRALF